MLSGLNQIINIKGRLVKKLLELFSENMILLLALQLIAFWHIWVWYLKRITDISDEPWGILALLTAIIILFLDSEQKYDNLIFPVKCQSNGRLILLKKIPEKNKVINESQQEIKYIIPIAFILLYAFTNQYLPEIFQAAIAFITIGYSLSYYKLGKISSGIIGLFIISLPILPSLQFYLGYPLRVFTSTITIYLLKLNGLFVLQEGTCLKFGNQSICLDVPCSGIKMLWTGLFLCFAICSLYKLNFKQTFLLSVFSFIAIIIGNIIRATALFYTESKIFLLPEFSHEGIGMIVFFFMVISISFVAEYMRMKKSHA